MGISRRPSERPIEGGAARPVYVVGSYDEFNTADRSAPVGANAAAVVTYNADPRRRHQISGLAWSYNATPTGGQLTITVGGNVVFLIYITTGGAGFFDWGPPIRTANVNTALVITLAAAGAAVTGSVNVKGHRLI